MRDLRAGITDLQTTLHSISSLADVLARDPGALIHGKTKYRDGTPLEGVRIAVHGHDEYGRTSTHPDGKFDMVVGGGGPLTVRYAKNGFLPIFPIVNFPKGN